MIREANLADKHRLVEMASRFIISTRYQEWIASTPERISEFVDKVLDNGVIFVCERVALGVVGGEVKPAKYTIVGMLALVVVTHPLTGRLYAEEIAWWTEPEVRNGTVGPRLMHHMERWCVQNRLHMVKMVAPADSSVGDFYGKCGYQAVETAWIKVLS